ncbi:DUF6894 family protein [Microvirga yunnanensis]|uniref:DUF6894 family protein n=1 Tax=Microvirga yunnanensis TaxID=2953740 RepID=UPI00358DA10C
MPLYHLHLRTESTIQGDPEGMDLPGFDAARIEALGTCRELWGISPKARWERSSQE